MTDVPLTSPPTGVLKRVRRVETYEGRRRALTLACGHVVVRWRHVRGARARCPWCKEAHMAHPLQPIADECVRLLIEAGVGVTGVRSGIAPQH